MSQTVYDVKEGAKLSCSLGTASSTLKIPRCHGACVQGQNQAVISDNVGNVNIMPFGACKRSSPPVPCTPTIVLKWLFGNKNHRIGGEMALLNISIVPCVFGGIIKIDQSGQKERN